MPEELWAEVHNIVQETVTKTIPKKNKCKKAKWFYEEPLQIAEERRGKKQERKGKIYLTEYRVLENSKENKKPSSMNNAKKRKTIEWERLEIFSRKLETSRWHFMQRWA